MKLLTALLPLVLTTAACFATKAAQAQGLQVTYGSQGLTTLTYNGVKLVDTAANGSDVFTVYEYERVPAGGTPQDYHSWDGGYSSSWDAVHTTMTWTYTWGTVACQYAATATALNMTITVLNTTTGDTINGVDVFPVVVRFPSMPAGYSQNAPQVGFTSDGPNIQTADYGTGVLDLCDTDVVQNRYCGFFPINNNTSPYTAFTVWASTLPLSFQPASYPNFNRPIAPGQSDTYTVSLRFGPEGTSGLSMASDITQSFAAAWPFQAGWSDHRSIGALFLATSQAHPPTNPRGWFNNDSSVDTTTQAGVQAFQQRVMQYAQTSIGILKQTNAQGMIQWDIEGQQYAQPTSYIGDPTLLPTLAPEMDTIADQYFAAFTAAGFKVGICVRPQQLQLSPTVQQNTVSTPAAEVITKIDYARKRWGCTLFYVDSNVDTNGGTLDAAVFQQIANAEPGVLIIPEHSNTKYYAYSSPYTALTNGALGTGAEAIATYPNAFSSIYTADGDMTDNYNTLVSNVSRGDILLFRSWFDDEPGNGQVRSIYAAKVGLPVITSASSASGTSSAAFSYQIAATNAPTSYGAAGLPAGLSVSPTTGVISGIPSAAGTSAVTLSATNASGTGTATLALTITQPAVPEAPYGGTPWPIPGKVEAENYDLGGEGLAYHDADPQNRGGAYREEGVDIRGVVRDGGGYQVGWTSQGEYLNYTVNVTAAGSYQFQARVSSGSSGGSLHFNVDGTNVTGPMAFSGTGSYDTFTTISSGAVTLTAGKHIIELYEDADNGYDINWFAVNVAPMPYNVWALWNPGSTVTNGGADTSGGAYNASLVGKTVSYAGSAFTLAPANVADAWSSVTVPLPAGAYTKLDMIGTSIDGTVVNQPFIVNYMDGSSQTFTQNLSDWVSSQGYAGETVVNHQTTRLVQNGTSASIPTYIYGYTFMLSGKPVKSITLPSTRQVLAFGFKGHS